MTTIIVKNTEIELTKGKPYMVKHRGGDKFTRRVFRGIEEGVLNMQRLVFTSKVKRNVYAIIDEVIGKDGQPNGVCFWKWVNTQSVPNQEISIPYFDIIEIKTIN